MKKKLANNAQGTIKAANVKPSPPAADQFRHAVPFQPRFSDFNLQGILKGSLYFDFVCETQLAQIKSRYGIRYEKYAEVGQKWNISDYQITFHHENKALESFWVVGNIVKVHESSKIVEFSFWSNDRRVRFASGVMWFDLFDIKVQKLVPISREDSSLFKSR